MAVVGGILMLLAVATGVVALLPFRMSITRRASLLAISLPVGYVGLMLYVQAVSGRPANLGSLGCGLAIALFMALAARLVLPWRLKQNRRDWESHWRHAPLPEIIRDWFKRYHDID